MGSSFPDERMVSRIEEQIGLKESTERRLIEASSGEGKRKTLISTSILKTRNLGARSARTR